MPSSARKKKYISDAAASKAFKHFKSNFPLHHQKDFLNT